MAETFKTLKGQLLLDSGMLSGSFFHRTVVLICQHDAEGAFGLVVNRSSDNKVGEMLVADLPDTLKEQPLYLGGPVQPTALSYLHADSFLPGSNVISNLTRIRWTRWSKLASRSLRPSRSAFTPATPVVGRANWKTK